MEKKIGFNFKRMLINAVVLFGFLIGLSYAAVVITNNDITKDGVSFLKQGDTWTAPQDMNGNSLTNGIISNTTLSQGIIEGNSNLTIYYPFEELTGSLTYNFDEMYVGTLNGFDTGINNGTSGRTTNGKYGNSMNFDGSDNYVSVGYNLNITRIGTISFWFKPNIFESQYNRIVSAEKSANTGNRIMIYNDDFLFQYEGSSTENTCSKNDIFVLNKWNHIVVTFNGTNTSAYHNGILICESEQSNGSNSKTDFRIGATGYTSSGYIHGNLDEFRLYNTSLSSSQITDLYHLGSFIYNPTNNYVKKIGGRIDGNINNTDYNVSSSGFNLYDGGALWFKNATDIHGCLFWNGTNLVTTTTVSDCP